MASAKTEAQRQLGSVEDYINLKGLNNERTLANNVYNTNTTSFQNAYNDLLNQIAGRRKIAKTDFGSGRAAVSENAYLQNRNDLNELASRGLNGGLTQLSKVGNRMETGRQFSNLANTYYNTMNELNANEQTGTNQYNTQMESAKNELNATLANINAREKAARNAYKAAVAQLAEQIQARRDAAAAAARALNEQKKANANNAYRALRSDLLSALGNDFSEKNVNKVADKYRTAIGKYTGKGSSKQDALNFMLSEGLYDPSAWKVTSPISKSPVINKNTYIGPTDFATGGRYIMTDANGNRIF